MIEKILTMTFGNSKLNLDHEIVPASRGDRCVIAERWAFHGLTFLSKLFFNEENNVKLFKHSIFDRICIYLKKSLQEFTRDRQPESTHSTIAQIRS